MIRRRRLLFEIDAWRTAWQQVEAFLDRIEDAADQDASTARRVYAALPLATLVEREHIRRETPHGHGLHAPLGGAPRGADQPARSAHHFLDTAGTAGPGTRVPGPEQIEAAVAAVAVDAESDTLFGATPTADLQPSLHIFDLRDAGALVFPTYDFGRLTERARPVIFEGGLFPQPHGVFLPVAERRNARFVAAQLGFVPDTWGQLPDDFPGAGSQAEDAPFRVSWSDARQDRRDAVEGKTLTQLESDGRYAYTPAPRDSLTEGVLRDLRDRLPAERHQSTWRAEVQAARDQAAADALEREGERAVLAGATAPLTEEGAAEALLTALSAAVEGWETIASADRDIADALGGPLDQLVVGDFEAALAALRRRPDPWPLLQALDAELKQQLDADVDARTAYPDGSLRLLRGLESGFRNYWQFRKFWFTKRRAQTLQPVLDRFLSAFAADLDAVAGGRSTSFPGTLVVAQPTAAGSPVLPVAGGDLSTLQPGQIAVAAGPRPTFVVVVGLEPGPTGGLRLKIEPLRVSLVTKPELDPSAGLLLQGTALGPGPAASYSDQEKKSGRSTTGAADGLLTSLARLWSQLRLLKGDDVEVDLPHPFPLSSTLSPLGPIATGDRLLKIRVADLPPGVPLDTEEDPPLPLVARPGELLRLRGRDAHGDTWQTAVEVQSLTRTTLQTLAGGPEGPGPECDETDEVVVVQVAATGLPEDLVSHLELGRDFAGFGAPSLATGTVLPPEVDPDTLTPAQSNGRALLRDPELSVATRLLARWAGSPR